MFLLFFEFFSFIKVFMRFTAKYNVITLYPSGGALYVIMRKKFANSKTNPYDGKFLT